MSCIDTTIKQKMRMRNMCLPDGYNEWVNFEAYVTDGVEATFSDTTSSVTKINSTIEEEMGRSTKINHKITMMVKTGTYTSQYLRLLSNLKKLGNQDVMNNFQFEIENAVDITLYPLCYMNLANIVYEHIDTNEYKVEFTFTANGKAIVRNKPDAIVVTENPYAVDVNLAITANSNKEFELTYDTTATSVEFEMMQVEIKDVSTGLFINTDVIMDGTTGTHTVTLTNDLPDGEYEFILKAAEVGYANNYIEVGKSTVTLPIVVAKGAKNGNE